VTRAEHGTACQTLQMKWASPVVQKLHERFVLEAVPWIEQRTVVIYGVTAEGNAVPDGSGVLLSVADQRFVLTAGHVLEDWGSRQYALSFGALGHIDLTSLPAQVSAEDKGDLALLPLTHEMAQRVTQSGKDFVSLFETDPRGDEPAAGTYAVLGYPKPWAKSDGNGGWVSHAIWYPTQLAPSLNYDPGLEILLEIDVENLDAKGDRDPLPYLGGISGCGIWRLHVKGDRPEAWSIDAIRLVGIEHHVVGKNEAIKGTRIRHVLAGIAKCFPDLERPITLAMTGVVKLSLSP